MKRELKFRGRCVVTGNWSYGYYYPSKGNHIIRDSEDKETIVMPESVGEFSGLRDINGDKSQELYDGDILYNEDRDEYQEIFYNAEKAMYCVRYPHGEEKPLIEGVGNLNTKAGNIYEHGHLIK